MALVRPVVVVAVGAGLVLGATHLPATVDLARGTGQAGRQTTRPHAEPVGRSQLVCPGPERLGIAGLRDSGSQTVSVTAVSAPREALPPGFAARLPRARAGSLTVSGLPPGGRWAGPTTFRAHGVSGGTSVARSALVTGTGTLAPGTVATQRSWIKSGDRRALVTAPCVQAARSSWLVAGGAGPGRQERLVLTNPGPNPVTVEVTVLGARGPLRSAGGRALVIAGHRRTVLLLDAIAGSEPSPVVHVTAAGGEVAAVLNDSWLDGLVPRGGDDAGPVAAPAREQVIAGVAVSGRATLRVAVPGGNEAVVQSRILTTARPRPLPSGGVMRVPAGSSRDIDLSPLPPGTYAVQVRADVPVVAAAMLDRRLAAGAPSDLAWSGVSSPIRTLAGMALRSRDDKGIAGRLDLVATGKPASVLMTRVGADGRVRTEVVAVMADSVSTVLLGSAMSVWVTPRTGLVRAAVLSAVFDAKGVLFSVTPLTDLSLTTVAPVLREQRD